MARTAGQTHLNLELSTNDTVEPTQIAFHDPNRSLLAVRLQCLVVPRRLVAALLSIE